MIASSRKIRKVERISIPTTATTVSDSSEDYIPHIVTFGDIRNETKFRPIRQAIFEIADSAIDKYNRLSHGEEDGQSDDEETIEGSEDGEEDYSDFRSDDSDSAEDEDVIVPPKDCRVLKGYVFGMDEFELLTEKSETRGSFRLKFELVDGHLLVRIVPGLAHGASAGFFSDELQDWARVPNATGLAKYTLKNASNSNYVWQAGNIKSPDTSFIPLNITIPPAKFQPGTAKPDFIGAAFPTIVFEIAHHHEPWHILLRDAREKAFSARTSVQVVVGIKLFKNEFKAFWAKRHVRGKGMKVMCMTEKIRLDQATRQFFLIPAGLIYWGCPKIPSHVPSHFFFSLEGYRRCVTDYA